MEKPNIKSACPSPNGSQLLTPNGKENMLIYDEYSEVIFGQSGRKLTLSKAIRKKKQSKAESVPLVLSNKSIDISRSQYCYRSRNNISFKSESDHPQKENEEYNKQIKFLERSLSDIENMLQIIHDWKNYFKNNFQ